MLFNSLEFALFLPVIFIIYWLLNKSNLKIQNAFLLLSSYYFYASWDWRFLFLLIFSTLLDYFSGIKMSEAKNNFAKKSWFWLSITINLGFLGLFKYYNFFIQTFSQAITSIGLHVDIWTLNVILPVGISFYTFHGLSYVIDIYNGKIKPEKNLVDYSLFVSFFPLLVAGPIERATHLLPQLKVKRNFSYNQAVDGLKQILWGLTKKILIADQCAFYVNNAFNNTNSLSGSTLVLGTIMFAFQIYGDFSGYSDIAIGTANLFGIRLLKNFAFPYFSRDIAEFWRRWHISLSSWFRDYLYIPLGGSKGSNWQRIRNTFVIFIVSGFWHGANWTFIIWGFLNALYIMPSIILNTNRNNLGVVAQGKLLPTIKEFFQIILTFTLSVAAWTFFRAKNLHHALEYFRQIFSATIFQVPLISGLRLPIPFLTVFFIIEWLGRNDNYAIENISKKIPLFPRWIFYYFLLYFLLYFSGKEETFIYFQF